MDDKTHHEADNLVGVPEPNPPEGGPNADPDTPDPADLVPGLGGTSQEGTKSSDEDEG
jgi:hypothetical protein